MRGALLVLLAVADTAGTARLTDPADQAAFRSWFTFLAEAQYFRNPEELPPEIGDCAALIRYAYRESLRRHDDAWRNSLGLRMIPSLPSIHALQYGRPPLGVNLFRTGSDSAAQFADARNLRQWNTFFVSRDLRSAKPGDLLFYRRFTQSMPFHAMVWLGASQVDGSRGPWLLYHTGPSGKTAGEIRRVSEEEMLRHPEPQWRPVNGNENFLGVYRWNIL